MLRRRVAERVSGLKKAGLELPIMSEVPQPAEIHYNKIFWVPFERIRPPTDEEPTVGLGFAYGRFRGELAGVWYRVNYPQPLKDATPVVVGTGRLGEIKQEIIEKVGDIQIPTIIKPSDINLSEISRPQDIIADAIQKPTDVGNKIITYYSKTLTQYIDEIYAEIDPAWESIAFVVWGNIRNATAQILGRFFYWLQEHVLNPRTNSIRDQINSAISDLNLRRRNQADYIIGEVNLRNSRTNTRVNQQFDGITDVINGKIGEINTKINAQFDEIVTSLNVKIDETNSKINDQLTKIEERVNARLDDLYAMWGIPRNMALTPLHLRNVDDLGFEFQSYGETTGYYIAVGGA